MSPSRCAGCGCARGCFQIHSLFRKPSVQEVAGKSCEDSKNIILCPGWHTYGCAIMKHAHTAVIPPSWTAHMHTSFSDSTHTHLLCPRWHTCTPPLVSDSTHAHLLLRQHTCTPPSQTAHMHTSFSDSTHAHLLCPRQHTCTPPSQTAHMHTSISDSTHAHLHLRQHTYTPPLSQMAHIHTSSSLRQHTCTPPSQTTHMHARLLLRQHTCMPASFSDNTHAHLLHPRWHTCMTIKFTTQACKTCHPRHHILFPSSLLSFHTCLTRWCCMGHIQKYDMFNECQQVCATTHIYCTNINLQKHLTHHCRQWPMILI
jgi:hypothetical protein